MRSAIPGLPDDTGTIVHIHGIADDKIGAISKIADPMEFMPDLLTTFAPYLLAYTDITIKYDGATIDPVRQIKKQDEKELVFVEEGKVPVPHSLPFKFLPIVYSFPAERKEPTATT